MSNDFLRAAYRNKTKKKQKASYQFLSMINPTNDYQKVITYLESLCMLTLIGIAQHETAGVREYKFQ